MAPHEDKTSRSPYFLFAVLASAAGILLLNYGAYRGVKWTGGLTTTPQTVTNSVRVGLSAILIGEFALVTAWAGLSRAHWLLRLAAVVLAICVEKGLFVYSGLDTWESLKGVFLAASILIVCLSAQFSGFQMLRTSATELQACAANLTRDSQFSLRELILLPVITAVLLTMMRMTKEASAAPLGIAVFAAAWAILATAHAWLRLLVLAVATPMVAAATHFFFYEGIESSALRYDLITWAMFVFILAAGFTAFRLFGYRLVRNTGSIGPIPDRIHAEG